MYGKKKYRPISKIPEQPSLNNGIPTYICERCHTVKFITTPFVELSLIENKKLMWYAKVCGSCTELLKAWIKG